MLLNCEFIAIVFYICLHKFITMGPYRTFELKKEYEFSLIEKVLMNMKSYGRKCKSFYEMTLHT